MKRNRILSALCSLAFAGTFIAESFYPLAEKQVTVKAEETSGDTAVTVDPVEDDYSSGDINGDGVINVFDYSRLNSFLNGTLEFDDEQMKAADFNYDRSVDDMDMYSMSQFITMYSEMPVNYNRRRLIINAKNFFLKYGETTDIELSIKIPDDWKKTDLSVFGDGEKITEIPFSSLTEGEKCERGGYSYTEYTVSVPVPDYGDEDTRGFSVDLTVQMNGQESYPVMLNRAVKDANERIEKSCELIGDLSDYSSKLPKDLSKDEVLSEMKKWIESNPDLVITSVSNDIINFKTSYGINSFFEVSEETFEVENETVTEVLDSEAKAETLFDMEEPDYTESNDILPYSAYNPDMLETTSNPDDLLKIYKDNSTPYYSAGDALTLKDPDVLLYAPGYIKPYNPLDSQAKTILQQITDLRKVGKNLAESLGDGDFDECDGSGYANWSSIQKWNQYGTVMWVAHGSSECDKNGDDRAKYQIYVGDDEAGIIAAAESLNNSLKDVSGFVEIPNGKLSFFPEDESLGVTYYLMYQGILANKYAISVGSGTLMQILSNTKFPNTVFVFGSCHGIVDDIFNQFLIDHGAAAVIGYEKYSADNIADKICKELLSCASTQRSALGDHAFSLKSSLIKANSKISSWSLYSDEVSLNASIYMKKDFYYWGRGDLTGKIVKNSFGVNKPVESATINAYRYYNDKMVLCKTVTTDADGKFSFENENKMNWGYYLMQVVKEDAEAFFKLDFTADNANLGEIVIGQEDAPLEMDDVYWYVWTYYPLYSTTIGTPDEINDWANKLRNRKVTVASMMRYFYELSGAEDIGGDARSYAVIDYTALVGRSPSDYERANLESKAMSGMSREDIIKYILSTGDFQTRCYELGIVGGMW